MPDFAYDKFIIKDDRLNDKIAISCGDFIKHMEYEVYDMNWDMFAKGFLIDFSTIDHNIPAAFLVGAIGLQEDNIRYIITNSNNLMFNISNKQLDFFKGLKKGMVILKIKVNNFTDQYLL